MWESVCGEMWHVRRGQGCWRKCGERCGKVCWGVREDMGMGVGKCIRVWGEVLGSVEGGVGKCVEVWVKVRGDVVGSAVLGFPIPPPHFVLHLPLTPQRTSLHPSPHFPHLPLTPQHTFPTHPIV